MRIAHITATFPPYLGGTGNVCFHNARELARRDHEMHVFTAAHPKYSREEILDGIHVHRLLPIIRFGNAPVLAQLISCLRGFDILHLHYPFFGGEFTALAAKITSTPLVITYHQDVVLHGVMGRIEKLLRFTIGRATLRAARKILFTSQDYGENSYIRPLLAGREHTIGELANGVNVHKFSPGKPAEALLQQFDITSTDNVALLVAGLDRAHYFKGVHVFLKTLARIPTPIKGLIVGDGEMRSEYEQMAEKLGISQRVFFAGRVADEALQDYYRLARVTVLPSVTMGEAFGLVLLESMSCGTPVIASNLPGVRTLFTDGEHGFLIPAGDETALADRMMTLAKNPSLAKKMGTAGRARVVQHYTWEVAAEKLLAIYQQVLSVG
jgi:glycosyltransferase involved in cell wall biosynthesis